MPRRRAGLKVLLDELLEVNAANSDEPLTRPQTGRRQNAILHPRKDEFSADTEYDGCFRDSV